MASPSCSSLPPANTSRTAALHPSTTSAMSASTARARSVMPRLTSAKTRHGTLAAAGALLLLALAVLGGRARHARAHGPDAAVFARVPSEQTGAGADA
ncbi:hypothetical protein CH063_11521 [Colletotrichum higginsianum]|uniref:Uncharacterized protein n=1 Tax=Colletotrichum higginsianum (strain IMI 349063) TaxID=759273 RepID=H1VLQ4_COLHI|nr:hypothetical protein CH063_11521 [Colletotrichum higginsianum]